MSKLFETGDVVTVKYTGLCYPHYDELAEGLGLIDYQWGRNIETSDVYKILLFCQDPQDSNKTIAAVQARRTGLQYLIDIRGLEGPVKLTGFPK